MYQVIKNAELFQSSQILEFLKKSSDSNIYCDPRFIQINNRISDIKGIQYMVINDSESIRAFCIGSVFSEFHGLRKIFTSRAIITSGIIYDCKDALDFLLLNLNKDLKKSAIYTRIPVNSNNIKDYNIFYKYGYIDEPQVNYIIDLSKGKENLWRSLHRTRRKQINRGFRRNIKTEIVTEIKDFSTYYELLLSTYSNAGLPIMDMNYFERVIEEFSKTKQVIIVRILLDNELIAHRLVLAFNDTLYDWYAGSDSKFHDHYPNDIAVWEILQLGATNGYKYFDFGGAGNPNSKYGVRDFKRKFGGNLVNSGTMNRTNQPGKYMILTIGKKIWSFYKKKKSKNGRSK